MLLSDLNADFIKKNYLFGIPITDPEGNELPDSVFDFYILAATQRLASALGIVIEPKVGLIDYKDFHRDVWKNYGFLEVDRHPILTMDQIKVVVANYETFNIPSQWLKVDYKNGQIQVFPAIGQYATPIFQQGFGLTPMLMQMDYVPAVFHIYYTAGMETIEEDMAHAICMFATIEILNILGDILLGAGIASISLGIDALSQSIGTTQSAENAAYSARIIMYRRALWGEMGQPGMIDQLRKKWFRIRITPF